VNNGNCMALFPILYLCFILFPCSFRDRVLIWNSVKCWVKLVRANIFFLFLFSKGHIFFSFLFFYMYFLRLDFLFLLLLCWVGVHCSIYKSSYNVSNISYLNSPLLLLSFISTHSEEHIFNVSVLGMIFIFVFFLATLAFELRDSCLLGRHSFHLSHSPSPFLWWVFLR
jgi:hypothetical protein